MQKLKVSHLYSNSVSKMADKTNQNKAKYPAFAIAHTYISQSASSLGVITRQKLRLYMLH